MSANKVQIEILTQTIQVKLTRAGDATDQAIVQRYTSGTVSSGCGTNLRVEEHHHERPCAQSPAQSPGRGG